MKVAKLYKQRYRLLITISDFDMRGESNMEALEKKYDTGMELKQMELAETFEISEDTLRMIDSSMAELKKGKASEAVDLSNFEE